MPRKTKNALTRDYNDNYFEVLQNTIVANNVNHGISCGPQGINKFKRNIHINSMCGIVGQRCDQNISLTK